MVQESWKQHKNFSTQKRELIKLSFLLQQQGF
jgi:hypothetical protein